VSQERFQKQQREKARREKAAAKWARRVERREAATSGEVQVPVIDEATVLAELADLHQRFEAGAISFDDFTTERDALIGRLDVR
jgi:hypothetical protein